MTEEEWRTATDPRLMLKSLYGIASERKLRLFAVACCRRLLGSFNLPYTAKTAIEVAERYADGEATLEELQSASCYVGGPPLPDRTARYACQNSAEAKATEEMADACAENAAWAIGDQAWHAANRAIGDSSFRLAYEGEKHQQTILLRDIFGPVLLRSISPPPFLLKPTVVQLATAIYGERAWDRLPILADALEETGYDNQELLMHCRFEGPHTRGCWVTDLLLGKV